MRMSYEDGAHIALLADDDWKIAGGQEIEP
jgi:hypothetical protein